MIECLKKKMVTLRGSMRRKEKKQKSRRQISKIVSERKRKVKI